MARNMALRQSVSPWQWVAIAGCWGLLTKRGCHPRWNGSGCRRCWDLTSGFRPSSPFPISLGFPFQERPLNQVVGRERGQDGEYDVLWESGVGRNFVHGVEKRLLPEVEGVTQYAHEHERLQVQDSSPERGGEPDVPVDA